MLQVRAADSGTTPVKIVESKAVVEMTSKSAPSQPKLKKLSYKLQRELEELPKQLEQFEADIAQLQVMVNHPDFFAKPVEETQLILDKLAATEQALEIAFERWEELEAMQQES